MVAVRRQYAVSEKDVKDCQSASHIIEYPHRRAMLSTKPSEEPCLCLKLQESSTVNAVTSEQSTSHSHYISRLCGYLHARNSLSPNRRPNSMQVRTHPPTPQAYASRKGTVIRRDGETLQDHIPVQAFPGQNTGKSHYGHVVYVLICVQNSKLGLPFPCIDSRERDISCAEHKTRA